MTNGVGTAARDESAAKFGVRGTQFGAPKESDLARLNAWGLFG